MGDVNWMTSVQGGVSIGIPGMESVIVTVSGYHGRQRFKLIKLIGVAGGNHVGNMTPSVTHLISWKFHGRKYEIAKRLNIIIVNHRWIEDCVRQATLVPHLPYTSLCGKQVGSILIDIPPSLTDRLSNANVIHLDCEDDDNAVSLHSISSIQNTLPEMETRKEGSKLKRRLVNKTTSLLSRATRDDETLVSTYYNENTFPERERRKEGSKLKGRFVNRTKTQIHSSGATHDNETSVSCYYNEPEELDSSTRRPRQKKISSYIEPLRRGRRLVRKNVVSDVLGSESEEECRPVHVLHWQDDITDLSNNPSASRGASTSSMNASDQPATPMDSSETEPVIRLAKLTDFFDKASTSALYASDQLATPKDSSATEPVTRLAKSSDLSDGPSASLLYASPDLSATPKDYSAADHVVKLNKSADVSCVICRTDFSLTRGVLPCGHRFCFSCIQKWADHMSSSGKISTCPLCKASFDNITKVDDAVSSDQKIYSQTIPHNPSVNIYVLPMHESTLRNPSAAPVCTQCDSREPEDLLMRCHLCQIRCVHSYCLDPYMVPWICSHCKDLRMLYHH